MSDVKDSGPAIVELGPGDVGALERVADDVFDDPLDPASAREFLADPRHHLIAAIDEGVVVGPDKPRARALIGANSWPERR